MSVTKVTGMMQTGTKGGDIPSASTLVIDTDGDFFDISGTTGITAMTVDAGRRFTLQFDGALTLTHGSSLYLPGATNFTTEANDCLSFIATAANTVRCTGYALKDGGSPVAAGGAWNLISSTSTSTTSEVEFTGLDTTYDTLALVISELVPTNDNKSLRLAFGDGSSYPSSSAKFCVHRWGIGETTPNYDDNSASAGDSFALTTGGVGDATGESCSGVWYIRGTSASSAYPTVHGESIIIEDGSGQGRNCSMIGQFTASTQLTKIKVWYLADTMATGRVALYGISNS